MNKIRAEQFTARFDAALKTESFEEMCNLVTAYIRENDKNFESGDSMWLSRTDVLAFPVLFYTLEQRGAGKHVNYVDFLSNLHFHKIANILSSESLSVYCRYTLQYYMNKIHVRENVLTEWTDDNVQNFCMREAIASLFDPHKSWNQQTSKSQYY